jgi:hypothetical protein
MNLAEWDVVKELLLQNEKGSIAKAIDCMASATATLGDPLGDAAAAEELVGQALAHLGEARGYRNAVVDLEEANLLD